MASAVIPYKYSEKSELQLRYTLRSLQKYLSGIGEVFIFGKSPAWVKNVTTILTPEIDWSFDKIYQKERAIYEKVRLACYNDQVSDDFLFMNDDHFLLMRFDASAFPAYFQGHTRDYLNRPDIYVNTLQNTEELVPGAKYFDVHAPCLYNSTKFIEAMEGLDWAKKFGYCIKTVYHHAWRIEGWKSKDLKIKIPLSEDQIRQCLYTRIWFSTADSAINPAMVSFLNQLYPAKSIYEK